eukprot:COSAG02_NODE_366_length_23740_cov_20.235904_5_plen_112_part_00
MRHFEAITPRALDGRYVLTSGSPPSHAFAEIEGSLPFLDREVQQAVESMVESLVFADRHMERFVTTSNRLEVVTKRESMVESLVFADRHMDKLSNHDLGVEVHDVPADGTY